MDFGHAKQLGADLSAEDRRGNPLTHPPEKIIQELSPSSEITRTPSPPQSDVWSIGITLFYLLTDLYPFSGFNPKFCDSQEEPAYDDVLQELREQVLAGAYAIPKFFLICPRTV